MKQLAGFILLIAIAGCTNVQNESKPTGSSVKLITLDPGHFHAALVQKTMYPGVDSVVSIYAPQGNDLQLHLDRINGYNNRADNPTHWKTEMYTGADFLQKMLQEKKGNVVVMAGNNQKKTEYIHKAVEAGLNVLADKPMAIDSKNFDLLRSAFDIAAKKNVLLYDIMTERYEITTMLQREFSMLPDVFGELEKGTEDNPAITKESIHHFYKYVSGNILTRPAWFMDIIQEGEGIVDVTTHLVDLVQWESFPGKVINYENDIQLSSARRWTTDITLSQFNAITKLNAFPEYLKKDLVNDTMLRIYCNGEINYKVKGIHAKVSVTWKYKAPEGTGDTHYSIMRGTKANLVIRQGGEEGYKPVLYIEPVNKNEAYETALFTQLVALRIKYPYVGLSRTAGGWEVTIPEKYKEGHEAHFGRVTEKFLQYLKAGKLPDWEVPNMIAKYYVTTQALELAKKNK